jgi:predicted phage terminase large subunit-like protein
MGPEKFSAQMLNSPISSETQVFKHSFFKPWDKIPEGCSRYLLLDPAISQKKSGDRSAIMAVYVSKENQIYVREYFAGRLLPDKLMDKLVEMALVHDPQSIGIETVAFQKTIVYELKKRMTKIGRWWVINEIKNAKTSKEERIKGLSPIYANGDVFHGPDMMELEDELLRFPKGQHDDLADALSFIQQVAFPGGVNRILVPEENIGLDSDGKVSTRLNPVIRTPQGLVVLSEMIPEDSGSWLDA